MTENPARVRSEGGAALGPDEHQARLTATMRRAERKAAADAARAKLLADFYSHKCRCGEQAIGLRHQQRREKGGHTEVLRGSSRLRYSAGLGTAINTPTESLLPPPWAMAGVFFVPGVWPIVATGVLLPCPIQNGQFEE